MEAGTELAAFLGGLFAGGGTLGGNNQSAVADGRRIFLCSWCANNTHPMSTRKALENPSNLVWVHASVKHCRVKARAASF